MFDSVVIGNKDSFYDYEASMKEREIGEPKKKSIKETVPFSNVVYDFTKINGEIYWEERPLTYVFEITADSPEFLEVKKQAFKAWVMNVHQEKLYDPYIENYHFIATFDDIKCDDSEIEKSTITVTFTAYPYMQANAPTEFIVNLVAGEEKTVKLYNHSSRKVNATIIPECNITMIFNSEIYILEAYSVKDFALEMGTNAISFSSPEDCMIIGRYYEEVF